MLEEANYYVLEKANYYVLEKANYFWKHIFFAPG